MTGTSLQHYQITAMIGAGGMGEVYRARDTRLEREVAIKTLPKEFTSEAERLRRFEQEARMLAALSHPNILIIYDVGVHQGTPYFVSELLEGQTLRDLFSITRNEPLPQRKAVDYALQIANALAAAHAKRIIHRDLKPENIFITKDGRVKILDFGLAKLRNPSSATWTPSPVGGERDGVTGDASTTRITVDAETVINTTQPGMVLGTVGYMSPEQVRGEEADHRSDIFAFGCILYEMLSAQRAFRKETSAETMATILKEDPPDLVEQNQAVSRAVDGIVRCCLEKQPEHRFQSAHDLGLALRTLAASGTRVEPMAPSSATGKGVAPWLLSKKARFAWMIAGVLLLVALLGMTWSTWRADRLLAFNEPVLFTITPPDQTAMSQVALSPNGRVLAFTATDRLGIPKLFLRRLDSDLIELLPETNGAVHPFWSPDGTQLGFYAHGKLYLLDLQSRKPRLLGELFHAAYIRGATWNRDGTILFGGGFKRPIYRISAAGGAADPLTHLDESLAELGHEWPQFLPDGRHFLYTAISHDFKQGGVFVSSIDAPGKRKRLLDQMKYVRYADPGYLLYWQTQGLVAQQFDREKLELTWPAVPIVQTSGNSRPWFSVSANGLLAYGSKPAFNLRLVWLNRDGTPGSHFPISDVQIFFDFTLSPDARYIAFPRNNENRGGTDLWLKDLNSGLEETLVSDRSSNSGAEWGPDPNRLIFTSNRNGRFDLFFADRRNPHQELLLLASDQDKYPGQWSRDGRYLLYTILGKMHRFDIYYTSLSEPRQQKPLLAEPEYDEVGAQLSPDGRWMAYGSNEEGSREVYVRRFPDMTGRKKVSLKGGLDIRWRGDGKELFYVSNDGELMAVAVEEGENGGLNFGIANPLFKLPTRALIDKRNSYVPTSDGQRFLICLEGDEPGADPIKVLVNWPALLQQ